MKLNGYQKTILLLYTGLFVYFTIIHVPFKIGRNLIEYDTLFSNRSNLDIGRLGLIILVISILSTVFFLLSYNINYPLKALLKLAVALPKKHIIIYCGLGVLIILGLMYGTPHLKEEEAPTVDTTSLAVDTAVVVDDNPFLDRHLKYNDVKKDTICTKRQALRNFRSHMKFYYPDWKIYGAPVIIPHGDCSYRIQFTSRNSQYMDKAVIIVEISYYNFYSEYKFEVIRGYLH